MSRVGSMVIEHPNDLGEGRGSEKKEREMRNRRFDGWLLASVALALLWAAPAAGQDLDAEGRQRMYYDVKPAVVFVGFGAQADIVITTEGGTETFTAETGGGGTGWLISPDGFLVTNGHVVELYHADNEGKLRSQLFYKVLVDNVFPETERQLGRKLTADDRTRIFRDLYGKSKITLRKELNVWTQNWRQHPAEVKEYSPPISVLPGKISYPGYELQESGKDVAILKIEGRDFPTVSLGDYEEVQLGQTVHVAGYPGVVLGHPMINVESALETSFTRGQVSSLKLSHQGTDVMQMDASITHGNSGGPVFNDRGEVISMATFGSVSQTATGETQMVQGFNFAVPISAIREFVGAAGIDPTQESLFDRSWDRALDAYYASQWTEALEQFDMALRIMPGLADAERLRRTSIQRLDEQGEAPPPEPVDEGLPMWVWIAVGVVALGLVLLVVGLMARRRGSRSAPAGESPPTVAPAKEPGVIPPKATNGELVVRGGPLRGNRFPVRDELKIGRDPASCQAVVSEPSVSREHALIRPTGTDSEAVIKNLSGTNPTYVNDRPIQETTLKPGDRIKIGETTFTYETR